MPDFINEVRNNTTLQTELLNLLTTNETWFFRHQKHFSIIKKNILPQIIKNKKLAGDSSIKIWSAGCSIGAELYSILFTILDNIPDPQNYNIQLTGNDISADAINLARKAVYSEYELRFVSEKYRAKYLTHVSDTKWSVKPEFTRYASFGLMNLLEKWPVQTYDIIFCRNTMIYFDQKSKQELVKRFFKTLSPDGYFFTSSNEILFENNDFSFKKHFIENEFVYQKTSQIRKFNNIKLATPSDLLRAMNLLKKNYFFFELKQIDPSHDLAPKRAIHINANDTSSIEELFRLNSIKILNIEAVPRN